MHKTYTFRELTQQAEITQFMQLRYATYENSPMRSFLRLNKHKIDIGVHDLHAKHYGLFCDGEAAGYVRIVLPRRELYNEAVYRIGRKLNFFEKKKHHKENILDLDYPDFPFLSHSEESSSIRSYFSDLTQKEVRLQESGRLALMEGFKKLRLAKFMVECVIVLQFLIFLEQAYMVFNCYDGHTKFYQCYGFQVLENSSNQAVKAQTQKDSSLLSLRTSLNLIPKQHHSRLELMAGEYRDFGRISIAL